MPAPEVLPNLGASHLESIILGWQCHVSQCGQVTATERAEPGSGRAEGAQAHVVQTTGLRRKGVGVHPVPPHTHTCTRTRPHTQMLTHAHRHAREHVETIDKRQRRAHKHTHPRTVTHACRRAHEYTQTHAHTARGRACVHTQIHTWSKSLEERNKQCSCGIPQAARGPLRHKSRDYGEALRLLLSWGKLGLGRATEPAP